MDVLRILSIVHPDLPISSEGLVKLLLTPVNGGVSPLKLDIMTIVENILCAVA